MKRLINTLLFVLLIGNLYAYTEKNLLQKTTDEAALKNVLILNQQWTPYPAYNDRAGWDNFLGKYKPEYIERGNRALSHEWIVITASNYLEYEKSGSRKIMEAPYAKNNQAIIDLFLAELAEGKGRFIGKLVDGVFFACEMTSWTISAHLTLQQDNRSLPNHNEHVIDLTSGDMGSVYAWIYYYLRPEFDKINPVISERLRYELEERILKTYMEVDRFWWMAFNYKSGNLVNNWNPWCNFNVLQCFMLLENDPEKLAKAVYRTMKSVDRFINYTNTDGACEEGPSYWGHAAGKLYDYLQLLYDVTGGKISIFNQPIIRNMGEYISRSYVGNGWVVNFADASAKLSPDADLIYRYGKAVASNEMMGFAAFLEKKNKEDIAPGDGRDIYRTLQALRFRNDLLKTGIPYTTPMYTWYPETQFCYMKTRNGLFFAAKGGHNNESHNHNDVGTFVLYANETPLLIDAGVGTYTRQTFGSERYSIWTMQSLYHNVPQINGEAQQFGEKFRAKNATFNAGKQQFSLDLSSAYPEKASVKYWKRTYKVLGNKITIKDEFEITTPTERNRLNFLARGRIDIGNPGKVLTEIDGKKMDMTFNPQVFKVSITPVELTDQRLSNIWGDTLFRITMEAVNLKSKDAYEVSITTL